MGALVVGIPAEEDFTFGFGILGSFDHCAVLQNFIIEFDASHIRNVSYGVFGYFESRKERNVFFYAIVNAVERKTLGGSHGRRAIIPFAVRQGDFGYDGFPVICLKEISVARIQIIVLAVGNYEISAESITIGFGIVRTACEIPAIARIAYAIQSRLPAGKGVARLLGVVYYAVGLFDGELDKHSVLSLRFRFAVVGNVRSVGIPIFECYGIRIYSEFGFENQVCFDTRHITAGGRRYSPARKRVSAFDGRRRGYREYCRIAVIDDGRDTRVLAPSYGKRNRFEQCGKVGIVHYRRGVYHFVPAFERTSLDLGIGYLIFDVFAVLDLNGHIYGVVDVESYGITVYRILGIKSDKPVNGCGKVVFGRKEFSSRILFAPHAGITRLFGYLGYVSRN